MKVRSLSQWYWRGVLLAAICFAAPAPIAAAGACVPATPEWEAMQARRITLARDDGTAVQLSVKLADDVRKRAAGFQHICPDTINETPILFVFPRPTQVIFHMHNVHAPLDIGFIDAGGRIVDIQHMAVYAASADRTVNRYYRSAAPVVAALETRAGLFAALGVTAGAARIEFTIRE